MKRRPYTSPVLSFPKVYLLILPFSDQIPFHSSFFLPLSLSSHLAMFLPSYPSIFVYRWLPISLFPSLFISPTAYLVIFLFTYLSTSCFLIILLSYLPILLSVGLHILVATHPLILLYSYLLNFYSLNCIFLYHSIFISSLLITLPNFLDFYLGFFLVYIFLSLPSVI